MTSSIIKNRAAQAFPRLDPSEIERLRRFGTIKSYADGEQLFEAGKPGPGMFVVLKGGLTLTRPGVLGGSVPLIEQQEGEFSAEIGQLSGKPSFVSGHAKGAVQVLLIPPQGLRSALVAEAELGERIMRALVLRRVGLIELGAGVVIVGDAEDASTARLLGFLTRNGQPHRLLPPSDEQAADIIATQGAKVRLPLAVCADGRVLENPSESELATCIGMTAPQALDGRDFDVAIIGAGPAGLAAAVYATSEGLSVAVFDARAFGGQAGASARIENYLGFPTGISGQALTARAYVQALKFGAEMAIPLAIERLHCEAAGEGRLRLELVNGGSIVAKTVVLAAGATYRRPAVEGLERFEGQGVWYWASPIEARLVRGQEVLLVGGGNSAGQAAVYLAANAKRVRILVREKLSTMMSQYLVDRIAATSNIEVNEGSEVISLHGNDALEHVRWRTPNGEIEHPVRHLFLFIGAEPATGWLNGGIALRRGFIATGDDIEPEKLDTDLWQGRRPASFETSVPGVFAIGDIRSGSVKRVGAAIGEGAGVVAQIHAHLAARASQLR